MCNYISSYYILKGKNDGTVEGVKYFSCRPKCGIFVRADKLIQDRRGRAMRTTNRQSEVGTSSTMKRSSSKGLFAPSLSLINKCVCKMLFQISGFLSSS